MNTREIVTLQIGHYSNFVGSHWWNCQEASFIYDPKVAAQSPKEINHDVLYREGQTVKGETTFTPRLVAFDLYHSLGSMKREGILYDVSSEEDVRWDGDVALHQEQSADKNPYLLDLEKAEEDRLEPRVNVDYKTEDSEKTIDDQDNDIKGAESSDESGSKHVYHLDNRVKVWSDYLRSCLHSRTMHLIKEHQHDNPEQPFDVFGMGEDLLSTREKFDAMEDRIRFFTEECDHLQGFHILVDGYNAFGGFASPILNYLKDEYPRSARISMSPTPACPPDQTARERSCRIINGLLSLNDCCSKTDLHLPLSLASQLYQTVGKPLSFPLLDYKANLDYHTSAIIASALDTFSLMYRKTDAGLDMTDITSAFNQHGRKIAALNIGMPMSLYSDTSLVDYFIGLKDRRPWMSLTPHAGYIDSPTTQACILRGISSARKYITQTSDMILSESKWDRCTTDDERLRLYLRQAYPRTGSCDSLFQSPLQLDASFPHIFKPDIGRDGFLSHYPRPSNIGVETVPLFTCLQTGSQVSNYTQSLLDSANRLNLSKHHHFIKAGLNPDDFKEVIQQVTELSSSYSDVHML